MDVKNSFVESHIIMNIIVDVFNHDFSNLLVFYFQQDEHHTFLDVVAHVKIVTYHFCHHTMRYLCDVI